jgi:hypothetical protein
MLTVEGVTLVCVGMGYRGEPQRPPSQSHDPRGYGGDGDRRSTGYGQESQRRPHEGAKFSYTSQQPAQPLPGRQSYGQEPDRRSQGYEVDRRSQGYEADRRSYGQEPDRRSYGQEPDRRSGQGYQDNRRELLDVAALWFEYSLASARLVLS